MRVGYCSEVFQLIIGPVVTAVGIVVTAVGSVWTHVGFVGPKVGWLSSACRLHGRISRKDRSGVKFGAEFASDTSDLADLTIPDTSEKSYM